MNSKNYMITTQLSKIATNLIVEEQEDGVNRIMTDTYVTMNVGLGITLFYVLVNVFRLRGHSDNLCEVGGHTVKLAYYINYLLLKKLPGNSLSNHLKRTLSH